MKVAASPQELEAGRKIREFIKGGEKTAIIAVGPMLVYTRKSMRPIGGNGKRIMIPCYDIANINVEYRERGKGWFKAFINVLEKQDRSIFVECILNQRLGHFLIRRGYKIYPGEDIHMYKLKE